ncbi:plant glycogenin-like starch initiation protein 6 [Tasmannia lanceolata]|uniref:plant glycogenin-like starch initiation protein 6 n=1 Tax=Tasmannia lanceolata TaxID=3420 RepID=UPI0040648E4A
MRSGVSNLGFLLLFFVVFAVVCTRVSGSQSEAYVTLLYGDEFLLGVRVLGKSIRETGSKKDMVVLVSDGVSNYAKKLLAADGWIVERISLLANPNQIRPKRFWGVYTKLKIFNLTNYKKVVYLDADTIVIKSIEDLFKCGKFCANLKHSERMNSGVMVVEPSETVFKDMMSKVNTLYSYTGGDQGFLNSYYPGFADARVFEPNLSLDVIKSRPVPELQRLSTLFNADVGLYMLANKWMVDEKELRVIHYTLGPLKPWDWWTAWLLKPVDVWQKVRERLDESLPGTGGGRNPDEQLLIRFLFLLPLCALLFCCYRSFLQHKDLFGAFWRNSLFNNARHLYYKYKSGGGLATYSAVGVSSSSIINSSQQFSNGTHSKLPAYLGGISVLVCFITATVSAALAFAVVPRQVTPWTGLLLLYEWTYTVFFIIFGSYLHLVYEWGKMRATQAGTISTRTISTRSESSDYDSGKGHQRPLSNCDSTTWFYGTGMAVLAVAVPSLPILLGITALFARLGLMVAGGLLWASFITYASEHLAIRAFLRGCQDHDQTRTRNICLLC